MRFLTAGESHGKMLVAILEGIPADLSLSESDINIELQRRQQGPGRSERMKIEKDEAEIVSGVIKGKTVGSPIALLIKNKAGISGPETVTKLRPGHADLAGALKYGQTDVRNVLERASARETAARVAVGAIAKKLLSVFNIRTESKVIEIGGESSSSSWEKLVEKAKADGDSLGGIFEVMVSNVPVGLGSYVQGDRRLSSRLAQAVMSIPAIKGVEFGLGFMAAKLTGSKVHDEILFEDKFKHRTNNAGGIEGGISNGEPIIVRAAMKPIATITKPLNTVDLATKEPCLAHVERADVCAAHAAAVVGEAVCSIVIADALLEKFGGDSIEEIRSRLP
ncbi:MAG: chorismate synthase [Candidatus Margulisiibacteriota bacterium]